MIVKKCIFCKPDSDMKSRMINGYKKSGKKPWVVIPRNIATFGHLLVVSGEHYEDISDQNLKSNLKYLGDMISIIHTLSRKMKEHLKTPEGKRPQKIYVVTQGETPHLHFHLIPRYEDDMKGNAFLFEKELQETRWSLVNKKSEDTNLRGYRRIGQMEGILKHHKALLCSNNWARSKEERKKFSKEIKTEIEKILAMNNCTS